MGLTPFTTYTVYARLKETEVLKESLKSPALTVTTDKTGGFPFVPSDKNMTNGAIKSGWAYIFTHDNGFFAPDDKGVVWPSRAYTLFNVASDTICFLKLWCYCYETEVSHVTLASSK